MERRLNVLTGAPPRAVSERARELHRSLLVSDLHADSLLYGRDLLRRSSVGHVDVPRLIEGNVALQAFAACVRVPRHLNAERNEDTSDDVALLALALGWPPATWRSGFARAMHLAGRARRFAARSEGQLRLIETIGDLTGYLERRRAEPSITAGLLTIEGAAALDGDPANVDRLADAGFRVFGMTHMVDNAFAGSSSGAGKGGLTPPGRRLVEGLVALGFWPAVLDGDDAAAVARSVARAVSVAGVDHVGLGSDFDGAVPTPFDATGLAQLTDALIDEGLTDDEVASVMGGNVVRVLTATLPD